MAKSKASSNRTRSGSQPKKKSNPTIFICPYTEQNVYIERATLADLKSKSTYHSGGKKRLWMLSSSQLRHELYADAAQAIATREQALLPSFGGRSWEVTCSMREETGNTLFRAWKGKMELAVLPHLMEKIPDPPRWPGRKSHELDEYFENDDEQDIANLQSREVSTLSSVAWDLKHLYPVPVLSTKWLSPCHKVFTSRKMAWDHATELAKREIFIDKHILGIGATGKLLQPTIPSAPMALKVGKLRFERDGLWVVNQELVWQEDRPFVLEEERLEGETTKESKSLKTKKGKKSTGFIEEPNKQDIGTGIEHDHGSKSQKRKKVATIPDSGSGELTLKQAEIELEELWKTLSTEEQENWKNRLRSSLVDKEKSCTISSCEDMILGVKDKDFKPEGEKAANCQETSTSLYKNCATEVSVPHISATNQYLATIESLTQSNFTGNKSIEIPRKIESVLGCKSENGLKTEVMACRGEVNPLVAESTRSAEDCNQQIELLSSAPSKQSKARGLGRKRSSRRKHPTEKAMRRWCLDEEQIELCYTACMSHYEDVMRTVKARDLARELADGFDVLRERGRGRFDMELPAFDTEKFSFLTDLQKAPWMPIVKSILGEDIVLIHKGCFLSLPDAETQVYHQDGVHLNKHTQKPCHAINVFVPLVDLTSRNGPTEFCLGSHILGNEGFDKDFIETPKPKAGTPVIFDYRLGHRGLGNSSTKCRPIVYCTYARGAADGKEFRDSVNFSRRRYHKIGELTQKPLSREERRLNRKRSLENRQVEAEAKKIAKLEQRQTLPKEKENEVEMLNVERPGSKTHKIADKLREKNGVESGVATKKVISCEKEKPTAESNSLQR